jgi:hypothetical protein
VHLVEVSEYAPTAQSVTRSFRFDSDLLTVLDEEAEQMGVSVNALVSIVLKRYSEFTRYLSKVDMVVINREILTSLIETADEETLHSLGSKMGETVFPDTVLFWKKDLSKSSVMEYIEKIICRYGRLGTFDEMQSPKGKMIVIRHRLGRKGSRFLEGYLSKGFEKTLELRASFETTESSVKCEIPT